MVDRVISVVLIAAVVALVRYGGGQPYPNLTSSPMLGEDELEEVLSYRLPIGNVAVSKSGRVFFTVHPEARPRGNKLLEYIDGASVPYPSIQQQAELFDTVLGVVIDRHNRLWTIDNGNHGFGAARLIAFDLATGKVAHDHEFRSRETEDTPVNRSQALQPPVGQVVANLRVQLIVLLNLLAEFFIFPQQRIDLFTHVRELVIYIVGFSKHYLASFWFCLKFERLAGEPVSPEIQRL